jgi:hypothetical protein
MGVWVSGVEGLGGYAAESQGAPCSIVRCQDLAAASGICAAALAAMQLARQALCVQTALVAVIVTMAAAHAVLALPVLHRMRMLSCIEYPDTRAIHGPRCQQEIQQMPEGA